MKTYYFIIFSILSTLSFAQTNTIGTIQNTEESLNGYTLFAPLNGYATYLINNCGEVVNKWTHTTESRLSVELLENGELLRSCAGDGAAAGWTSGGSAGRLEKVDWFGNVTWSYDHISGSQSNSGQFITHHDFEVLPNGNILVLAWFNMSKGELLPLGLNSAYDKDYLWMEKIMEIEPSGSNGANIVWEWKMSDHLVQDTDPAKPNYGSINENPNKLNINTKLKLNYHPDLGHANSIDYNPELDQVLITLKNLNEIWVLDHSTTTAEAATNSGGNRGKGGDILYRWGNPMVYESGELSDRKIVNPHHAEWIPEGYRDAGKIMLYNNGDFWDEIPSKITMIDPNINADGSYPTPNINSAYLPTSAFWEYTMDLDIVQPDFISDKLSGVYRLENGNTLICNGSIQGYLIELDSNDNIVWEYFSPAGSNTDYGDFLTQGDTWATDYDYLTEVFRAIRYNVDYSGLAGQDLTPGDPIELSPNINNCTIFTDPDTPPVSIDEYDLNIQYTNPISNELTIQNFDNTPLHIVIVDLQGRKMVEDDFQLEQIKIDAHSWNKGIYFLTISDQNEHTVTRKIIKQ